MADTTEQAAYELAKFLTTPSSGYNRKSPLDEMIQARITQMAREIATEVVAATPELADVIRGKVRLMVAQALRDDTYMAKAVTDAVATAAAQVRTGV